jgi:hypothetical protein
VLGYVLQELQQGVGGEGSDGGQAVAAAAAAEAQHQPGALRLFGFLPAATDWVLRPGVLEALLPNGESLSSPSSLFVLNCLPSTNTEALLPNLDGSGTAGRGSAAGGEQARKGGRKQGGQRHQPDVAIVAGHKQTGMFMTTPVDGAAASGWFLF